MRLLANWHEETPANLNSAAFGMQFFWGVFLADLQNNEAASAFLLDHRRLSRTFSTVLIFLGLTLASYPEGNVEWMAWSRVEHRMLRLILPEISDFPRFASGMGLEMITLGLHFSPWMREVLSSRYLIWFGKQSFAVYLLHGALLRTVLCWMVYGVRLPPDTQDENGNQVPGSLQFPGTGWLVFCLVIWIPLNYGAAMLWTNHVDPLCARVTEAFAGHVTQDKEEKPALLPC